MRMSLLEALVLFNVFMAFTGLIYTILCKVCFDIIPKTRLYQRFGKGRQQKDASPRKGDETDEKDGGH